MSITSNSPMDSLILEHKAMQLLIDLIKQEQTQLIEADIDGLKNTTVAKSKVANEMSELAKQRDNALAAAGFSTKKNAMDAWLKTANPDAKKQWEELLSLTKSAKELNRINGILIAKHMSHNQNALAALHAAPPGGNVYGPNGQSTEKPRSGRLVVG